MPRRFRNNLSRQRGGRRTVSHSGEVVAEPSARTLDSLASRLFGDAKHLAKLGGTEASLEPHQNDKAVVCVKSSKHITRERLIAFAGCRLALVNPWEAA